MWRIPGRRLLLLALSCAPFALLLITTGRGGASAPLLLDPGLYPEPLGARWRTPMRGLPPPLEYPHGPSRVPDNGRLRVEIERILDGEPRAPRGDFSLVVEDLTGDFRFELQPDRRWASASLVKVPIAMAVYEELQAGRIPRNAGFPFLARHCVGGSGELKSETVGMVVPLRDLLHLSLAESDNTATNILADAVGARRINRIARTYFGPVTDYRRGVLDLAARKRGLENWTTAAEMANAFAALHRRSVVSVEASDELLRLMSDTAIDDRIQRYLPERIPAPHKTGLLRDVAHDCGLILLPGNRTFVVAAMSRVARGDFLARKRVIGRIVRALYEASVPPHDWERPRRVD